MTKETVLILLEFIGPNPYQVRQAEDPVAVAELAANIEKNSLLQPPTVRKKELSSHNQLHQYQLAFGHSRLAAYKLLAGQKKTGYRQIPCFVKDLDDLQMFELAVAENIKRRDLNPIERARAMQTYMDKFTKTSAETGEFFACDEATVRGTVRLLGLPEAARAKLSSGEITIGAARALLTLQRIAPEDVEVVTQRIVNGGDPLEQVTGQLRRAKNTQVLQESYASREHPTAGEGLWRLDLAKFPEMPKLTAAQAQAAGAIGKESGKQKKNIQGWIGQLEGGLVAPEALIAQGVPTETVERLAHLVSPPTCSQCSIYVQSGGLHVCGWPACWQRKVQAWSLAEAGRLSKKLGIQVYDPGQDGEYVELDKDYKDAQKIAFKERIPGLRLMAAKSRNYGEYAFTRSRIVELVDVTPEAIQAEKEAKKEQDEKNDTWEETRKSEDVERKQAQQRRELSDQFMHGLAVPVFATVLEIIKSEKLLIALVEAMRTDSEALTTDEDGNSIADDKLRMHNLRCGLISEALEETADKGWWEVLCQGPVAVAKHLQTVAADWGVSLPEDWIEKAALSGGICVVTVHNDVPNEAETDDDGDDDG